MNPIKFELRQIHQRNRNKIRKIIRVKLKFEDESRSNFPVLNTF